MQIATLLDPWVVIVVFMATWSLIQGYCGLESNILLKEKESCHIPLYGNRVYGVLLMFRLQGTADALSDIKFVRNFTQPNKFRAKEFYTQKTPRTRRFPFTVEQGKCIDISYLVFFFGKDWIKCVKVSTFLKQLWI